MPAHSLYCRHTCFVVVLDTSSISRRVRWSYVGCAQARNSWWSRLISVRAQLFSPSSSLWQLATGSIWTNSCKTGTVPSPTERASLDSGAYVPKVVSNVTTPNLCVIKVVSTTELWFTCQGKCLRKVLAYIIYCCSTYSTAVGKEISSCLYILLYFLNAKWHILDLSAL